LNSWSYAKNGSAFLAVAPKVSHVTFIDVKQKPAEKGHINTVASTVWQLRQKGENLFSILRWIFWLNAQSVEKKIVMLTKVLKIKFLMYRLILA
jgi:hypothetical protein